MVGDTSAVTVSAESGNSTETLYIEVREDNTPVDPLSWFFAG
jgi:septal ring factor EnvC (AmiA/AmiB activator)